MLTELFVIYYTGCFGLCVYMAATTDILEIFDINDRESVEKVRVGND